MCRAVWVIVVGGSEEACRRLRRAAGIEVQVVAMATAVGAELDGRTPADVVIVDAAAEGSEEAPALIATGLPGAAIVWAGEHAPEQVHGSVPWNQVDEVLPSAITKALIARRAAGRTTT